MGKLSCAGDKPFSPSLPVTHLIHLIVNKLTSHLQLIYFQSLGLLVVVAL